MADNNMNLNSSPEQELDLEQLEQVSGGIRHFIRSTEPEHNESDLISSGIVPKTNGVKSARLRAVRGICDVSNTGGDNDPEERRRS
jgi:hypothetical protein